MNAKERKRMRKKVLAIILVLTVVLMAAFISGCGSSESSSSGSSGSNSGNSTPNESEKPQEEPEEKVEEVAWEEGEPVITVWTNSIGSRWIQVMVPVTNTGTKNLYSDSVTLDIEDAEGHLIDTMDLLSFYPQVLQPGETGWVYEETTLESESDPAKVITHIDFSEATVDCIRFEVSDLDIRGDDFGDITVTGRIENATDEEQTMIDVVVFLYDANDMMIGKASDLVSSLKAGEKMGFSANSFALPDSVDVNAVARYEVVAYPYQFQW